MRLYAITVKISSQDRQQLGQIVGHPATTQRLAFRCRCVLGCADGVDVSEVARQLGVTGVPVRKWRDRFREKGLEGLKDAPKARPAA